MWYSKQLRQVCRARKVARTQQNQLLTLALEGIVALTLHSAVGTLTVPVERAAGAQVVDTLREALRDRRDRPLSPKPGSCARTGRKAKRCGPGTDRPASTSAWPA